MKWGLHYREFISGISAWLEAELDQLTGSLSAWAENVTTQRLTASSLVLGGATQPVLRHLRTTSPYAVTSSATITAIPGFEVAVETGQVYALEAVLFMTAGAAGGYRLDLHGTCTASSVLYHLFVVDNDTDVVLIASTETALGSNRSGATPVSATAIIRGTLVVQVGGFLRVGFAQAGASGTPSVVLANSRFMIQTLPEGGV